MSSSDILTHRYLRIETEINKILSGSVELSKLLEHLAVGVAGGLITAVVIFMAQSGWSFSKEVRLKNRKARKEEENAWKTMHLGTRQGITNKYLFSILLYLFLGNLLWLIPEAAVEPIRFIDFLYIPWIVIAILTRTGALFCFTFGLVSIIRYLRLRSLDTKKDE